MRKHWITWVTALLVVLSVTPIGVHQTAISQHSGEGTADAPVEVDRRYEAYGFPREQYDGHDSCRRLSDHEIDVLSSVILAYAALVARPVAQKGLGRMAPPGWPRDPDGARRVQRRPGGGCSGPGHALGGLGNRRRPIRRSPRPRSG